MTTERPFPSLNIPDAAWTVEEDGALLTMLAEINGCDVYFYAFEVYWDANGCQMSASKNEDTLEHYDWHCKAHIQGEPWKEVEIMGRPYALFMGPCS